MNELTCDQKFYNFLCLGTICLKERVAVPVFPPQNCHLGLASTTKADAGSFIWKRRAQVAVGVRSTAEVKTDPRTGRGMKDPSHLPSPLSAEPEGPGDDRVPQQPKAWASSNF